MLLAAARHAAARNAAAPADAATLAREAFAAYVAPAADARSAVTTRRPGAWDEAVERRGARDGVPWAGGAAKPRRAGGG